MGRLKRLWNWCLLQVSECLGLALVALSRASFKSKTLRIPLPPEVPEGDIKAYVDGKPLPQFQAISVFTEWVHKGTKGKLKTMGTLVVVVMDRDVLTPLVDGKEHTIRLKACDIMGPLSEMSFTGVRFLNSRHGISLDDLAVELLADFSAEQHNPWEPPED